jgi:hypothetical protein
VTEESSDEGSTSSQETIHHRGRNRGASNGSPISPRTTLIALPAQDRRSSVSRQNINRLIALSESRDQSAERNDVDVTRQTTFTAQRAASPVTGLRYSYRPTASTSKHAVRSLLPDVARISFRLPWMRSHLHVNLDCRTLGEDLLLLSALLFAVWKFHELQTKNQPWLFAGEYLGTCSHTSN